VRHFARQPHERPGGRPEPPLAALHRQFTLEDVERFVLAVVNVQRRRKAGRDQRFDQPKGAAGGVGGGLDGHAVAQEPDRVALARGEKAGVVGSGYGSHGSSSNL